MDDETKLLVKIVHFISTVFNIVSQETNDVIYIFREVCIDSSHIRYY